MKPRRLINVVRAALLTIAVSLISPEVLQATGNAPAGGAASKEAQAIAVKAGKGSPAPAKIVPNSDCMDCHEAPAEPIKQKPGAKPKRMVEIIKADLYAKSVHGKLNCVDCHVTITDTPHASKLPAAQCASCHDKAAKAYDTSIHGVSHKMSAKSSAATCASCHGTHETLSAKNPASSVHKLSVHKTCGTCHNDAKLTAEYRLREKHAGTDYMDSIHGQALIVKGLIVAPSCTDCHGVHDIQRGVDKNSHTHHAKVAGTCGKCHVGVEAEFRTSVHGKLPAVGDKNAPSCSDCHTAHRIEKPSSPHFKSISDQRCGKCHQDRLVHYKDTYHGKAMALGRPNVASDVAACYDCHGHHGVFPVTDPRSRLAKENIVKTCQACHPGVGVGFTKYAPHADPMDAEHYPLLHAVFLFMTSLLIGVFAFFGFHTLLWLVRSVYLYVTDSKTFREAKVHAEKDDEHYTRFTPFERFLHLLVVTSFLLLVITGMPLKFYYANWARILFDWIGGPDVARSLHRLGALITFLYFGLHLIDLAREFWARRGTVRDPATGRFSVKRLWGALFSPDSMVPSLQDWRDFIAHQKWFFGKGEKPQFDRWTYWERFDYFAVFWGVAIIGASGLIMWIPDTVTRFVPGWIINIAMVVHSDEALLAAGFIFTFHFFNTHFRLEKFPMDTVIFSGRISKTEMLHERRRWYDRLVAEGRLDQHRVRDDWESRKSIMRGVGFTFFGIGLILLILIAYAMISRLMH